MAFLLRVELPDVPGSLGTLATALGRAGADIEAIEIVEHRNDGFVIDDVLLEIPNNVMPDALVTACQAIDGVRVHWISRYNAGANLSMDLEAVEAFTAEPDYAIERLVDVIPDTFRTDWAMSLCRNNDGVEIMRRTATAPEMVEGAESWVDVDEAQMLPELPEWGAMVLAALPGKDRSGRSFVVVAGRHGGPEFLTSEIARLAHIVSLAASVQTP